MLERHDQLKPRQGAWLAKSRKLAARDETLYKVAEGFSKAFGKAFRSSGVGRTADGSGFLLDWGLIELDPERVKNPEDLSECNVFSILPLYTPGI